MLCEKILGRSEEFDLSGKAIDYVEIQWYEAFKKIHRKVTKNGEEIGIRLDDTVLSRGLYQGDVLWMDETKAVLVQTPPCQVIVVTVAEDHRHMIAKVCYEIGNRHAPLFYGKNELEFITPYNEPMLKMLEHMHGVMVETTMRQLDFEHRISQAVHNHQH